MASVRRQANAKQQRRDAHGRFAGGAEPRAGEVVRPDRAPVERPASGAVETVVYRLPGEPPVEPPASGEEPPVEQGEPVTGEPPASGAEPPASGEPATGEPPVEPAPTEEAGSKGGGFRDGLLAPMVGRRV